MIAETFAALNRVVVQHAQGAKVYTLGIVVISKAESMVALEPSEVHFAAGISGVKNRLHCYWFNFKIKYDLVQRRRLL
jgi:hypothetical protein